MHDVSDSRSALPEIASAPIDTRSLLTPSGAAANRVVIF